MITVNETFCAETEYPLSRLGDPEDLLFFDIETTGFSADKNEVYMIGVLCLDHGEWQLCQWLCDSQGSEGDVLDAFFSYLRGYKILISFNGDAFDIPFLLKRCRILHKSYNFDNVRSVDIYKQIRPYKNILGLENCRQKSIESFLGIEREDVFNGGELINIYIQFLYTHDPSFSDLLLLHNADDLRGMPKILSILSYPDLFGSQLYLLNTSLCEDEADDTARLIIECESELSVLVPVKIKNDPVSCEINGNRITFYIDLLRGTLKHYFPNPSDYDYLIYEDMAVHKSVGRYVAREARKQATPSTCYIKQDGLFLPQFKEIWEPVMKAGRNDKMCYILLDNASFDDLNKWNEYSHCLLDWLGPGSS